MAFASRPSDWLPLTASCLGTITRLTREGVPMPLLKPCGTGLWVVNNILVGSIGDTALEIVIAAINLTTVARMLREKSAAAPSR